MVSLKHIASELAISPGLVSKVLNGRLGTTGVSPERRDAIMAKAKAMGYHPNRTARALKTGRVGSIGVFMHAVGEAGTEIALQFLKAVSQALSAENLHLWLTFYHEDTELDRQLQASDIRHHVDALLIAGQPHPTLFPVLHELSAAGLPVVTTFEVSASDQLLNVCVDNFMQSFIATSHLVQVGCTRIAHFSVRDTRLDGYKAALDSAGITLDPSLVVEVPSYKMNQGRFGVKQLLNNCIAFDGIVGQSDHHALGAIIELSDKSIAVPDQVRVVGIDDSPLCSTSSIPITSVSSEAHEVGRIAVSKVLHLLNGEPAQSQAVRPRLVRRASS